VKSYESSVKNLEELTFKELQILTNPDNNILGFNCREKPVDYLKLYRKLTVFGIFGLNHDMQYTDQKEVEKDDCIEYSESDSDDDGSGKRIRVQRKILLPKPIKKNARREEHLQKRREECKRIVQDLIHKKFGIHRMVVLFETGLLEKVPEIMRGIME